MATTANYLMFAADLHHEHSKKKKEGEFTKGLLLAKVQRVTAEVTFRSSFKALAPVYRLRFRVKMGLRK